jgi:hypothetical protein
VFCARFERESLKQPLGEHDTVPAESLEKTGRDWVRA